MARVRLPSRRPSASRRVAWQSWEIDIAAGYDPTTGALREVFASGCRVGSDMALLLDDVCVALSIALQHGATPRDLRRSLGVVPVTDALDGGERPASVVGAVVAALCDMEIAR